ncbi:MAG: asparagine synthase (glutamine-hydrolyzing) [Firmicutes bacterium]|nr:asparagine synthase (glutamine-hydrolyzing) [Bacillota bacterium]
MCGFIGFTTSDGEAGFDRERLIGNMCERIRHRGPDDGGTYIDEKITLGFRRLSIIDLSDGGQPMKNEDGHVVIVFNGEIYNFMELRDDLIEKGHVFKTRCDTEVVLHGYEQYGEDIVKKLRGMFAFVIWDANAETLFAARDFFGIKPFYYTRIGENIVFGSEIKAMLEHPELTPSVNENALRPYLSFQYSSGDETFFEGIYKLPPAHTLTFRDGNLEIKRYWSIDFDEDAERSEDDFVAEIANEVKSSVTAHKISDVPVGSFLSGGVDSSYVTATLMPRHTFSVGFSDDKFNETNDAVRLSEILGVEHHTEILTPDECFDAFPDIQYHMDEPQANPSSVPLWFLSKLTRKYVTVVLSGEGADEIYGGYEWYEDTPEMRKYKRIPRPVRRAAARTAARMPYFKGHDFVVKGSERPEEYFIGEAYVMTPKEADEILTPKYRKGKSPFEIAAPIYKKVADKDELTKKQYLDLCLWLPGDILLKADKMSMAHSIELRVPYLDRVIMKSAERIPSKYRVNEKASKYAFRRAASEVLPEEWANRHKKGFPVPIKEWLREDKYYSVVKEYFTSDYASEFFDTEKIIALLDGHKSGRVNCQRKIWVIFTFLVWYKRFFIDYKKHPCDAEI